jgi:succinate dehydrogenase flavin-adding protein (antitoxin of CptAB toxin-antitoxin module)
MFEMINENISKQQVIDAILEYFSEDEYKVLSNKFDNVLKSEDDLIFKKFMNEVIDKMKTG